jgi:PadR family transcriptional regulator, regulatory protein AphA
MEQLETSPIVYGMLGLLELWGPLSGYDLKRLFDHTLAPMWGAAQSQIYKELRRMKELGWVDMQREEQDTRPDRKVYSITERGYTALRMWQAQPAEALQVRDELLLKVLFGASATPSDLAQNLRARIAAHEMRLLAYRQNALFIPQRGAFHGGKQRPNPYAAEGQEEPYFRLVAHFAIEFERVYISWLYEALALVEPRQEQAPPDDGGRSPA